MLQRRLIAGFALAGLAGLAAAAVGSWSTAGPSGGFVTTLAVYEASPNTLWGAGPGGVFRTTSSGSSWSRVEVGLPDAIQPAELVAASSSPVLYVAGMRLYRSGNGGDLWITTGYPAGVTNSVEHVALRHGTTNSVAISTGNAVYVSADGGGTWTGPGGLPSTLLYGNVEYAADGTLYVAAFQDSVGGTPANLLYKSTTGGVSWVPATNPASFFSGWMVRASVTTPLRLFFTDSSSLATSANGGSTWSPVALPVGGTACGSITAIATHPTVATALFVGCRNRGLIFTADATVAAPVWSTYNSANGMTSNGTDPAQPSAIAVHPTYATTPSAWLGTNSGGLLATTNGGTNWAPINFGFESVNIRAIAASPGNANLILAGTGDSFDTTQAMYLSVNSGISWNVSNSGLNAEQIRNIKIDPTTADPSVLASPIFTVYAAGRSERLPATANKDGGIYKSINGGVTWTTIDNGIAFVPPLPSPAAARDMGTVRGIYIDPRSCAVPPVSGPCPFGTGPLQTLIVTGGGRPDFSAGGLPYVSARVYKSTNAGGTWTASETGLPLPQELGGTPPPGFPNLAYEGVVPIVSDPTNTSILYIGTFLSFDNTVPGEAEPTIPNGVFKSINGGATWTHSSNGLPRIGSPASSGWDVLALALVPAHPLTLYATAINFLAPVIAGRVYKSIDGGASWINSSSGLAGTDVRALYIDPNDATGATIYAGSGGTSSNPGGVFRSTDGGVTWNSFSLNLPADAATALEMPKRALGAPARLLAGTSAGVWDYTAAPDDDADGVSTPVENSVFSGDGNSDGIQDATQKSVASLSAPSSRPGASRNSQPDGSVNIVTVDIVQLPSGCTQLNNTANQLADLYPPDPLGTTTSHDPYGLVTFSLPACAAATVKVTFHGASFGPGWVWRNYGPRTPGNDATFGWYTFSGAKRLSAETWQLTIDATHQGNYRNDANNILFVGGPGLLTDLIFDNAFE